MSESIYLVGSEQVQRAGHEIDGAASQMKVAASQIEFALQQHQRFLDDWLQRFECALETAGQATAQIGGGLK